MPYTAKCSVTLSEVFRPPVESAMLSSLPFCLEFAKHQCNKSGVAVGHV